jgi:DNA invertase Pin-like site-specific DNA recombinase
MKGFSTRFLDKREVIELKEKGLSARAIAMSMECSTTLVQKILKEIASERVSVLLNNIYLMQ